MKSLYCCAAIVIAMSVADSLHATEPAQTTSPEAGRVDNGGFENPVIDAYRFFDERLPGWTVSQGEVEIINEAYGHGFQAHSGSQFLALNGAGAVYQDVPTRPGSMYRLVFHLDNEPDATGPATLMLSAGAASAEYEVTLEQSGYRQESLRFEGAAGSQATRITFTDTTGADNGVHVDDVTVESIGGSTTSYRGRDGRWRPATRYR